METQIFTDSQIREYLLGRLDADSKLVEQIDIQILTEPDFSLSVDVIEDEIIEEYIEGKLTLEDKQALEGYFLLPPERQSKLRKARLLVHHLSQNAAQTPTTVEAPATVLPFTSRRLQTAPVRIRSWAAVAAVALVSICLLSLLRHHRRIASLQELGMSANQQPIGQSAVQANLAQTDSIVALNLFPPSLSRGQAEQSHALVLPPGVTTVHVEIALLSSATKPYRARVVHNGVLVWTSQELRATAVGAGAVLRFDIPASIVPDGECAIELVSEAGGKTAYPFTTRRG